MYTPNTLIHARSLSCILVYKTSLNPGIMYNVQAFRAFYYNAFRPVIFEGCYFFIHMSKAHFTKHG
jgi:hypothetical protein